MINTIQSQGKKILIAMMIVLLAGCTPLLSGEGPVESGEAEAQVRGWQIESIKSPVDFNENGIDDYGDFLEGARIDARNHPRYDGSYVDGGYPADDVGVCTDVIWRAFKYAGYNLRAMVDADIALRLEDYTNVKEPDTNIDFRRVKNLRVFFEKHGVVLTTDLKEIEQWQPGDIVVFRNEKHIGMLSDVRNRKGEPFVIHNLGQRNREEDYLNRVGIVGHYRFDASVTEQTLIPWKEGED